MALCMINEAEKRGDLRPGGTIVDQSTGNTGPALSFVGNTMGYDVEIFLPAQLGSAYNSADRVPDIAPIRRHSDTDRCAGVHRKCRPVAGRRKSRHFVAIRIKQAYDLQQANPSYWFANQLCNADKPRPTASTPDARFSTKWTDRLMAGWLRFGTGGTCLAYTRP